MMLFLLIPTLISVIIAIPSNLPAQSPFFQVTLKATKGDEVPAEKEDCPAKNHSFLDTLVEKVKGILHKVADYFSIFHDPDNNNADPRLKRGEKLKYY